MLRKVSSDAPIFIVGWPRSGTTLVAKMLASHPRLCCGPETHLFSKLYKYGGVSVIDPKKWPDRAVSTYSLVELTSQSLLKLYQHSEESFRDIIASKTPSMESILSGLYSNLLNLNHAKRVVEKTPNHIKYVELIRYYFPNSPIIRIVRDPRDSAQSMGKLSWMPDCPVAGALLWRSWFDQSKSFFEMDAHSFTLKYEDLIYDTENRLRELCLFIDEKFDIKMLEFYKSKDTLSTAAEVWKKDVSQKLNTDSAYRWKTSDEGHFTETAVNHICGDIISYFDYQIDENYRIIDSSELSRLPLALVKPTYMAMAKNGRFKALPIFYGATCWINFIINMRSIVRFICSFLALRPKRILFVQVDN